MPEGGGGVSLGVEHGDLAVARGDPVEALAVLVAGDPAPEGDVPVVVVEGREESCPDLGLDGLDREVRPLGELLLGGDGVASEEGRNAFVPGGPFSPGL